MIEALGTIGVLLVGLVLFVLFIGWMFLPFLIMGTNRRLDRIHSELYQLRQAVSTPTAPTPIENPYGLAPTPIPPPPP